MTIRIKLIKS